MKLIHRSEQASSAFICHDENGLPMLALHNRQLKEMLLLKILTDGKAFTVGDISKIQSLHACPIIYTRSFKTDIFTVQHDGSLAIYAGNNEPIPCSLQLTQTTQHNIAHGTKRSRTKDTVQAVSFADLSNSVGSQVNITLESGVTVRVCADFMPRTGIVRRVFQQLSKVLSAAVYGQLFRLYLESFHSITLSESECQEWSALRSALLDVFSSQKLSPHLAEIFLVLHHVHESLSLGAYQSNSKIKFAELLAQMALLSGLHQYVDYYCRKHPGLNIDGAQVFKLQLPANNCRPQDIDHQLRENSKLEHHSATTNNLDDCDYIFKAYNMIQNKGSDDEVVKVLSEAGHRSANDLLRLSPTAALPLLEAINRCRVKSPYLDSCEVSKLIGTMIFLTSLTFRASRSGGTNERNLIGSDRTHKRRHIVSARYAHKRSRQYGVERVFDSYQRYGDKR